MRLVTLRVRNLRSIADQLIVFQGPHSALVGFNNAGKSNILLAIEWVLGSKFPGQIRPDEADYYDPKRPIIVDATLGDISEDDKKWLFSVAGSKQRQGALGKRAPEDVTLTLTLTLPAFSDEPEQEDDSAPNRPSLVLNLWGFDIHQKTADRRRALLSTVIVSPHRRVREDLTASRWTAYGQLMKAVLEASPQYEELSAILRTANEKIQLALADEKEKLLEKARVVAYVDDLQFRLTKENNPAELLRNLEIFVEEDDRLTNIALVGTGTQNAVIIGMLELFLKSKDGRAKIFAIEEPEVFIHPAGVRYLGRLLQESAKEPSSQTIIASHSPTLLAALTPGDLIRVDKREGKTIVIQPSAALTARQFARFINEETAEMFFAKRIILVEGDTEKVLLPPLSRLVKKGDQFLDFDRDQIVVVRMGSKDNLRNFIKIAMEFQIQWKAVVDRDFLTSSTLEGLLNDLRKTGASIDDSNQTQLRKDLRAVGVAVLSRGDLEDYIPDADVSAITGHDQAAVAAAVGAAKKRSDAFKGLFGVSKPQYARQLAEHYQAGAAIPNSLEQLVSWLAA